MLLIYHLAGVLKQEWATVFERKVCKLWSDLCVSVKNMFEECFVEKKGEREMKR